jgi:UDP-2-acetamido-2-deoxy-ribo-hexuluronate aminotransferase
VEFVDLQVQYQAYRDEMDAAIRKVVESSRFVGGPEIGELERKLAEVAGVRHCIACSNGTDALLVPLLAWGVGPGDEVIVPDFTFVATAEVVTLLGASPRFVDVRSDTYCLDAGRLEEAINPRTRGIIPVSLFGQCADYDAINAVAARHGLWVLEDAAQSFGAMYRHRPSCSLTACAATSFFPAKPLGCYGDGGAMFTDDDALAESLRCVHNHGQAGRYHHVSVGLNARLDTLQAAVLLVKLRHYRDELAARNRVAALYTELLRGAVEVPRLSEGNTSNWAQYTIRVRDRDAVRSRLASDGIPTAVHYPAPLHRQPVYAHLKLPDGRFPVSVQASGEVLSLPMHGFLPEVDVRRIAAAVREAVRDE